MNSKTIYPQIQDISPDLFPFRFSAPAVAREWRPVDRVGQLLTAVTEGFETL